MDRYGNDREIVMSCVKEYGQALKYASQELRNDKDIVMTAVTNHGDALEFASDDLKKDSDIVHTAVFDMGNINMDISLEPIKSNGFAIQWADSKFRNDTELLLKIIELNPHVLYILPLKDDENFLLRAIEINSDVLKCIDSKYLNSECFMRKAIKVNSLTRRLLPKNLKFLNRVQ